MGYDGLLEHYLNTISKYNLNELELSLYKLQSANYKENSMMEKFTRDKIKILKQEISDLCDILCQSDKPINIYDSISDIKEDYKKDITSDSQGNHKEYTRKRKGVKRNMKHYTIDGRTVIIEKGKKLTASDREELAMYASFGYDLKYVTKRKAPKFILSYIESFLAQYTVKETEKADFEKLKMDFTNAKAKSNIKAINVFKESDFVDAFEVFVMNNKEALEEAEEQRIADKKKKDKEKKEKKQSKEDNTEVLTEEKAETKPVTKSSK